MSALPSHDIPYYPHSLIRNQSESSIISKGCSMGGLMTDWENIYGVLVARHVYFHLALVGRQPGFTLW
ncbi:MAG: hypothetical protein SPI30_01320 [Prevotella sp.]|nr:hypothetical protein [Prevotella sp.]